MLVINLSHVSNLSSNFVSLLDIFQQDVVIDFYFLYYFNEILHAFHVPRIFFRENIGMRIRNKVQVFFGKNALLVLVV